MTDPGWPDWNKLSSEVKRVLRLAEQIANNFNKNRVTAAHIMLALTRIYPHEVSKIVKHTPLTEVSKKLSTHLVYVDKLTDKNLIIKDALFVANFELVQLRHLIEITAGYCGFRVQRDTFKESPNGIKKDEIKIPDLTDYGQPKKEKQKPDPFLNRFGRDLTQSAIENKLHPIIGRDKEINLVAETLCRVFKRNPLLVGPAGVGKTAIVEGLAQKLESEDIAPELQGKRIIEMNVGSLLGGTKYRGEFEQRIMQIIDKVKNTDFILFIDEFHTLVGAGITENSTVDATSMLLPALARGEIACIGATTDYNYHRFIQKDKAFERRFQTIRIQELPPEDTINMLEKIGPLKFEKPKNIKIEKKVYRTSIDLAKRYMRNRYFPDKALDIIDHAVGRIVRKGEKQVTVKEIKNVIGSLTGLPIGKLEDELRNKLNGLTSFLKNHVLGQDHIADIVVDIIWPKTLGADLDPERPNGVFLFVGPTGVGKTEFARALALYLFGSQDKLIRVDMSEYSEPHTVAKLLGAPFGYHGYQKGSPILDEIEEKPFSILLLDEIEKAHPEVHKLFLQVFDSGILTDTNRRHTYFSDVIIIMTSNIPVERDQHIGFLTIEQEKEVREKMTKYFVPEFLNRIDYICVFNSISNKVAKNIVKTRIIPIIEKKWKDKGIKLQIKPEVVSFIVEKGFSKKWGARNLERNVDKLIISPLAKFAQDIKSNKKTTIEIFVQNNSISFKGK